jgi:hypothetical protein
LSGSYLLVGHFDLAATGTATMYRYLLSSTEDLVFPGVAISTPTQVQGVVVADGYYIFSTSYGRRVNSHLKFKSTSTGIYLCPITIPPMSEGIVRVPRGAAGYADDWLYVNFESASTSWLDPEPTIRTYRFPYALITTLTP